MLCNPSPAQKVFQRVKKVEENKRFYPVIASVRAVTKVVTKLGKQMLLGEMSSVTVCWTP